MKYFYFSVITLSLLLSFIRSVHGQSILIEEDSKELQDSINIYQAEQEKIKLEKKRNKELDKIKRYHLKYKPKKDDSVDILKIHFVGKGDIQSSLSNKTPLQGNTGLGVIVRRNYVIPTVLNISDYDLDISINVASSVDTLLAIYNNQHIIQNTRDFGTSLMLPGNSDRAASIYFKTYFSYSPFISGFQIRTVASSRVWQIKDTLEQTTNAEAATLLFRAGVFHDFIPKATRNDKEYSILLGLDLSMRWLFGDLDDSKAFGPIMRNAILGKDDKHYLGIEPYISIKLKNITAEVSIPYLDPFGSHIPGLTGAQFLTTIRFVGGFPLEVK